MEDYRGEPLILEGSQPCICLTLTQDRVDKLYNEFDRDGTDTFGFDVSMNYSVFFPYTYTDEFSKTASWRPFFQKRSFEMYTA